MNKFQEYRMLSKNVRMARRDLRNKFIDIVGNNHQLQNDCYKKGCVSWSDLFIFGGITAFETCHFFQENDYCAKTDCPMHKKQTELVDASTKYDNACSVRRDFIRGLFHRSK